MGKKILFVIGDLDRGGAEMHLSQLLPLLKERKLMPYVYTLTHKGVLSEELEAKGIPIKEPTYRKQIKKLPVIISRPLIAMISFFTLWVYIRRVKPDVIHFFLPYAYLLGGICSLFAHVPNRFMSRRSLNTYSKNRPLVRILEKILHKKMDVLLGNSQEVIKQLKDECEDHNKIKLIYNGARINRLDKSVYQKKIREELGIADNCLLVTMVANIIPYKGHIDLLHVTRKTLNNKNVSGFSVLCVGRDNGTGRNLRNITHQLGISEKIHWLGERKDVAEILCASDIGLHCSHQEGFSNSVLESMAAGLPMVVTDVGGNKEAVKNNVNGYVVPAHDTTRISDALASLLESKEDREEMGAASKKIIEEKFTQELCVKHYIDLYESI